MKKIGKQLEIDLTDKQILLIKKFLLKHKIKCDGKTGFSLIAEPKLNGDCLVIRLLSVSEYEKVDKFFQKMGFYNEI